MRFKFQEVFPFFISATFILHYVERDVPDGEVHVGEFSEKGIPKSNMSREAKEIEGVVFLIFPSSEDFN